MIFKLQTHNQGKESKFHVFLGEASFLLMMIIVIIVAFIAVLVSFKFYNTEFVPSYDVFLLLKSPKK